MARFQTNRRAIRHAASFFRTWAGVHRPVLARCCSAMASVRLIQASPGRPQTDASFCSACQECDLVLHAGGYQPCGEFRSQPALNQVRRQDVRGDTYNVSDRKIAVLSVQRPRLLPVSLAI